MLEILIELVKVLIDVVVLALSGQVYPQIEDAVLLSFLEGFKKLLLHAPHYLSLAREVSVVPILIRFPHPIVGLSLLLNPFLVASVCEQSVEELNAQHLNLSKLLEGAHINVRALSYIQKDTVQEEQESLDVQVLTPRETEIKEEFR